LGCALGLERLAPTSSHHDFQVAMEPDDIDQIFPFREQPTVRLLPLS